MDSKIHHQQNLFIRSPFSVYYIYLTATIFWALKSIMIAQDRRVTPPDFFICGLKEGKKAEIITVMEEINVKRI